MCKPQVWEEILFTDAITLKQKFWRIFKHKHIWHRDVMICKRCGRTHKEIYDGN